MIRLIRWILELPARRRARRALRQLQEDFRAIDAARDSRTTALDIIFPPEERPKGRARPCSHTYDHESNGDLPIPAPSTWRRRPEENRDD